MTNKCVFPDCDATVKTPHVTCVAHWRSLPPRIQAAVQERIRGWKDTGAAREFVVLWHRNEKRSNQL